MYFKSLQMKGFKSFIDETNLDFSKGVTSIVGPNGCGKSNIYDAIRWVLGEQSPKLLRGKKMEDLIFNGTQTRKPLGMAEVSLTMGDLRGELSSDWGNFDEIKVTRRLFRDGESEFFINKIPCRLRDIVELFLDTGVSTQTFSLIEQGQIGAIINSKPEDRRLIIEEAAGIIKYKHKKNIALRKLEHSNQNLLRLEDIISEIRRQINSLKRQARKAERYKGYQKRIQELELSIFSNRYSHLNKEFEILNEEFRRIDTQEVEVSSKNSTLENRIEDLKLNIVKDEKDLSLVRREAFDLAGNIDKLENRIELYNSQIKNIKEERERAEKETVFLKDKSDEIDKEIICYKKEEEDFSKEISDKEGLYLKRKSQLEKLEEKINLEQNSLDQKKVIHVDLMSQISQEKNQLDILKNRLENLQYREEKLEGELEADLSRYRDYEERLEGGKKESFLLKQNLEKIKRNKEIAEKRLEETQLKDNSVEDKIREIQTSLTSKASRLKSLEEFEANLEGYQQGVRYLMKHQYQSSKNQRIHGVVADLLETSSEYEVALSAVLGERLQSLVVENHDDIKEAVQCLKSNGGGRGTFIPLKPKSLNSKKNIDFNGEKGVINKAVDLIKYKDEFKDVLEFLLGDVIIVENFSIALELWIEEKFDNTLVTLDGDVLEPSGVVIGGNFKNNANLQLLRKRKIIGDLKLEIDRLNNQLEKTRGLKDEIFDVINKFKKELEELDIAQKNLEKESLELEKDLQHLEEEYLRIKERIDLFDFEKGQLSEEKEKTDKKIKDVENDVVSLSEKKEESEKEINRFQKSIALLNNDRETQKGELTELAISLTSLRGKKENSNLKIQQIIEKKEDIKARMEDLKNILNKGRDKEKEYAESINEMELSLKKLFGNNKVIDENVKDKERALYEKKKNLEALEEEAKKLRRDISELKNQINEVDIKKTELLTKMKSIEERVTQDYGFKIEDILEREEGTNLLLEDKEREMGELKDKLSRLGDVNLTALEEYKNLETRYNFLNEQKEDLTKSIESLHKVIDRINRTTKNMFKKTFDAVNSSFQDIVSRLFEGGKGELVLSDEGNLLETGLDIMIQPAGKKLQNITLLSVGEKALTAIALLFSVFLVRPAPFCLLDEVDAPLDEANIEKFANILRELSKKTQFIIITHNKRTMSFSDILYGITMEERGISKVVSLQLNSKN